MLVIGAAPKSNVIRKTSEGDVIVPWWKDGRRCGGATSSSKEHIEESIQSCGAECKKVMPHRKNDSKAVQRPQGQQNDKSAMILVPACIGSNRRVGRRAFIDLDSVPKKYEGLDGTELAISESQERMAVLISSEDAKAS